MYVWRYRTIPPNLSPEWCEKRCLEPKPPNLMTTNISGYTVYETFLSKMASSFHDFDFVERLHVHDVMGIVCISIKCMVRHA